MSAPTMQCPACTVPLVMSERQNVEIDYCPQCRGVWLDRGELDKIIERASAEQQKIAPQPALQNYRADPYAKPHYHKRRKSFLEELFD